MTPTDPRSARCPATIRTKGADPHVDYIGGCENPAGHDGDHEFGLKMSRLPWYTIVNDDPVFSLGDERWLAEAIADPRPGDSLFIGGAHTHDPDSGVEMGSVTVWEVGEDRAHIPARELEPGMELNLSPGGWATINSVKQSPDLGELQIDLGGNWLYRVNSFAVVEVRIPEETP